MGFLYRFKDILFQDATCKHVTTFVVANTSEEEEIKTMIKRLELGIRVDDGWMVDEISSWIRFDEQ